MTRETTTQNRKDFVALFPQDQQNRMDNLLRDSKNSIGSLEDIGKEYLEERKRGKTDDELKNPDYGFDFSGDKNALIETMQTILESVNKNITNPENHAKANKLLEGYYNLNIEDKDAFAVTGVANTFKEFVQSEATLREAMSVSSRAPLQPLSSVSSATSNPLTPRGAEAESSRGRQ